MRERMASGVVVWEGGAMNLGPRELRSGWSGGAFVRVVALAALASQAVLAALDSEWFLACAWATSVLWLGALLMVDGQRMVWRATTEGLFDALNGDQNRSLLVFMAEAGHLDAVRVMDLKEGVIWRLGVVDGKAVWLAQED